MMLTDSTEIIAAQSKFTLLGEEGIRCQEPITSLPIYPRFTAHTPSSSTSSEG